MALKKAKQLLIEHAVINPEINPGMPDNSGRFGNLPCPYYYDNGDEGTQSPQCGGAHKNAIGYFPWRRMGADVLRDQSGTCLLYAVSAGYKMNTERMLNSDSAGLFQIVDESGLVVMLGNTPEERPVAVIFAPGSPVGVQARNIDPATICGKDFGNMTFQSATDYLDNNGITDNGTLMNDDNKIDQFVRATLTSVENANPLNDTFITISQAEIWNAVMKRSDIKNKLTELTEALALCLGKYAKENTYRRLPWPAPMNLSAMADSYFVNDNYDDSNDVLTNGYFGRYPFKVDNSDAANDWGATTPPANIFDTPGCDSNLVSPIPPAVLGNSIDLTTGEYRELWENWKDHFFYALSNDYKPNDAIEGICGGNCVSVNGVGNKFAAIVFYSGSSIDGSLRTSPEAGDVDKKKDIANYLENNNKDHYPDLTGDGAYQSGSPDTNDVMFCVRDELTGVTPLNVSGC